ncbi:MAG: hypothetical protein GX593_09855 [Actinomycetales bacterium]|nr:hypothetical protein [Actinomycetales bacterium]
MSSLLNRTSHRIVARWVAEEDRERGDVPGWVLVTLMTAGLVLLIWGFAGPALSGIFNDAVSRVSGEIGG